MVAEGKEVRIGGKRWTVERVGNSKVVLERKGNYWSMSLESLASYMNPPNLGTAPINEDR